MRDSLLEEEARIAAERMHDRGSLEAELLDRPIRAIPSLREPVVVKKSTSLHAVIERMNRERIGCVLVVDDGRLVGVFTERDILTRVVGQSRDLEHESVGDLMTTKPECLTLDDSIAYALNKMAVGGFRHIPLIDIHGHPAGVIAMRHIVEYLVDLFPREVLNLPPSPRLAISRTREGA